MNTKTFRHGHITALVFKTLNHYSAFEKKIVLIVTKENRITKKLKIGKKSLQLIVNKKKTIMKMQRILE